MRRFTSTWYWAVVGALLLAIVGASVLPAARNLGLSLRGAVGQVAAGAMLYVLAADVEVAPAGGDFGPARDGMTVGPGDQIRTSNGGVAVLSFFDGSETQLTPDSQVQIQQAAASGTGAQISVIQVVGTTVQWVQLPANEPSNYSTNTPGAMTVARGTRHVLTTSCYSSAAAQTAPPAPPVMPTAGALTFPRRLSGVSSLLAAEAIYDDNGTLWEHRAWRDAGTGATSDTYDELGTMYPEIDESVYQEVDGSYWLDREWQDPATLASWHTYENVGVALNGQTAATRPQPQIDGPRIPQQDPAGGCHPETSVVVIDGSVGMLPTAASSTPFDVTLGNAGAASDAATATSGLTPQAQQAFASATTNPLDVNGARAAGQLGSQVADEFAAVVVPSVQPPDEASNVGTLLGGVVVRSATADSGLQALVVPLPSAQRTVAQLAGIPSAGDMTSAAAGGVPATGAIAVNSAGGNSSQVAASNVLLQAGAGALMTPGAPAAPRPGPPTLAPVFSVGGLPTNSATIGPGGGQVRLPDGSALVQIPPGAVEDLTNVQIVTTGAPGVPGGDQLVSNAVAVTATGGAVPITQLLQPVQITLGFTGTPPTGLFFFDGSGWQELSGSIVSVANHTVTAPSTHFTIFAALAVNTALRTPTPTATSRSTATSTPTPIATATAIATSTSTPTQTVAPNMNLSGSYALAVSLNPSAQITLILQQPPSGGNLNGSITGCAAQTQITGNISASNVNLQTISGFMPCIKSPTSASLSGRVTADGKTISGTYSDSSGESGTFTATRATVTPTPTPTRSTH
jgi:hypothetical protein